MALVIRRSRPYLYKSVRKGDRGTSAYLGSGMFALAARQAEAERRQ